MPTCTFSVQVRTLIVFAPDGFGCGHQLLLRSDGLDVLVWSPGAPFAERRKHGIRVYSFSHRDASTASTSTPPLPTRQKAQRRQRRRGGSLGWIRRPSHGCSRNTCNDFYDIVTILRRPQLPILRGDRLMLTLSRTEELHETARSSRSVATVQPGSQGLRLMLRLRRRGQPDHVRPS